MSHLGFLKTKITKEGMVRKSASSKGEDKFIKNSFKTRWFVLKGRTLRYYKDHASSNTKPKGEILLNAARVDPMDDEISLPYSIRISQAKQVFNYFVCDNEEDQVCVCVCVCV
jgi:hypothetical protein